MYYDKIRIHFVYGFLLDKLAGYSLQVKTTAKYLGPVQCHHDNSLTHMKFDDRGNPIFETELVTYTDDALSYARTLTNNDTTREYYHWTIYDRNDINNNNNNFTLE